MPTANPNAWPTAITQIEPNSVRVRGYDLAELMGNVSFGAMVFLILRGELPSATVARLMDAILGAGIDHGATPPPPRFSVHAWSTGSAFFPWNPVVSWAETSRRHHNHASLQTRRPRPSRCHPLMRYGIHP